MLLGTKLANASYDKFSLYAKTGYRVDNLNWSISGFNGNYTINSVNYSLPTSSELTWEDIEIYEIGVGSYIPILNINPKMNLFLHLFASNGDIIDGKNQDSDYFQFQGQQIEFSRSNNDAKSGDVEDYSFSLNYEIALDNTGSSSFNGVSIIPFIGYSTHKQNLTMTNGYQTIDLSSSSSIGPFSGLNSTYETNWQGPFLGMALNANFNNDHNIEISGKLHIIDYYAQADWNLRSDFAHPKSFEHEANGQGITFNINYKYKVIENLILILGFDYKNFQTNSGVDRTFFSNGTVGEVTLDEVNWNSTAYKMGIEVKF